MQHSHMHTANAIMKKWVKLQCVHVQGSVSSQYYNFETAPQSVHYVDEKTYNLDKTLALNFVLPPPKVFSHFLYLFLPPLFSNELRLFLYLFLTTCLAILFLILSVNCLLTRGSLLSSFSSSAALCCRFGSAGRCASVKVRVSR